MRDPDRLHVMEAAMKVAELTYHVTRRLPPTERAGLHSQMRRCAASIGANIAEGCGRNSDAQFVSFLNIAMGSACELEFHAGLTHRLALASPEELRNLGDAIVTTKRMLSKLISALKSRALLQSPRGGASRRRPESERSDAPREQKSQ
jgi:four helix bundle protein